MQTLRVITLGCSKNTVDTEHLLYQVKGSYEIVPEDDPRAVDVEAINTCGFIGDAKEQSVQVILEEARKKTTGLIGRLLVFGCLSQRYPTELPDLIPEVDGWFGARELDSLVRALGCVMSASESHKRILTSPGRPYAYFKISEGCNRRCSYCAIPFIRCPHRSVPVETLVAEARDLAAKGIRELVIIAQDTTYYGLDIYGKRSLARLLKELSGVDGIEWLRLHYSYPADFPEDVLTEMAVNPKLCRYMDIPLQHISDSVLAAMHRGVDGAWTRALIDRMRERVPGVVLRTTMIVGHPGEGSREFNELLQFVREARFQRLGAFTYSEEEGTFGAEHLKDSVRPSTKKKRLDALMEAQRGISLAYNQSRVGTVEKVLADSLQDGVLVCRSEFESPEVDGEILVKAPSGVDAASLVGTFFNVRITAADEYDLTAEII